jgi:hypothetical protein
MLSLLSLSHKHTRTHAHAHPLTHGVARASQDPEGKREFWGIDNSDACNAASSNASNGFAQSAGGTARIRDGGAAVTRCKHGEAALPLAARAHTLAPSHRKLAPNTPAHPPTRQQEHTRKGKRRRRQICRARGGAVAEAVGLRCASGERERAPRRGGRESSSHLSVSEAKGASCGAFQIKDIFRG